MAANTNVCTPGFKWMTRYQCQFYSQSNNFDNEDIYDGSWSDRPKGCHLKHDTHSVYFNLHPTGDSALDLQPICIRK